MAKRSEIWTVAGGPGYASKPRPAVIVQEDAFSSTDSVTICIFTSDPTEAPLFRPEVHPAPTNGLALTSRLMVDKITTVRRSNLGYKVGKLSIDDQVRLNTALMVFLGLAESPRARR